MQWTDHTTADHTSADRTTADLAPPRAGAAKAWADAWLRDADERIIRVCCHCRRALDARHRWRAVPARMLDVLMHRPEIAVLSHGICPSCYRSRY